MVYNHIQTIKNISGTNDKLKALKSALSECPLLERVFHLALSTEHQYGVKKIPEYHILEHIVIDGTYLKLEYALDVLETRFSTNAVTGNQRIDELKFLLQHVKQEDAEVLKMILDKSLDCGISTTNANKVLSNKIPVFNVMLCGKRSQKTDGKFNISNSIAQTKSDGMRVIISVDAKGNVKYRTRNGKELQFSNKHQAIFGGFPNTVFDGEALIRKDGKVLDRKTGNGIMNSIQQGKASEEDVNSVVFMLWDVLPYDDFFSGQCGLEYSQRFAKLTIQVELMTDVAMLPEIQYCTNWDEAEEFYADQRAKGEEGIIIKDLDGKYEAKRVNHQLKMKAEETADLIIIDLVEGTGKNEGKLGAMTCSTEDGLLQVNVGTGFSDELRELYWAKRAELIGDIVEVKYNEVIQSKGKDKASLFLPVFVELRTDKDVANKIAELK